MGRQIAAWLVLLMWGVVAQADEFQDLTATLGPLTTLAGTFHAVTTNPDGTGIDFWSPEFEGAPAREASLSNPHIAAADAYGNVYIADKASHAILRIDPQGILHTFAGTHVAGFNGDGPAPATELQISFPNGLFVFPDGTVYLLDPGNHRIRKVDTHGIMTTVVNDEDPRWYPSGRALWVSPGQDLIYYTHEYAPVPPSLLSDGATVKQWTPARGIETVCSRDVGFRNPGNIAVSPADGKLYVTDRAEEDTTRLATGLFRIDGPERRTRITGDVNQPKASSGQLAINSFIEGPRGIAFLPDGSCFLCAHKGGDVWFVDTDGVIHRYIQGSGKGDTYLLTDGQHPPLTSKSVISQPRAVTLAPNGDLIVVSNDSGYVFRVQNLIPAPAPASLRIALSTSHTLALSWEGVWGRGYRVESTSDLSGADWAPVGAVAGQGAGVPVGLQDPAPAEGRGRFYRVVPSL
jgi:DNA-binding beta-propeller fold protein YncE